MKVPKIAPKEQIVRAYSWQIASWPKSDYIAYVAKLLVGVPKFIF